LLGLGTGYGLESLRVCAFTYPCLLISNSKHFPSHVRRKLGQIPVYYPLQVEKNLEAVRIHTPNGGREQREQRVMGFSDDGGWGGPYRRKGGCSR
jgi:hypothetical protein